MSVSSWPLSVVFCLLLTTSASAIVRRHDVADSEYLSLGNSFQNAVWVGLGDGGACSGALIAPDAVLSACHCFDGISETQYSSMGVGNGRQVGVSQSGGYAGVKEIIRHPGWGGTAFDFLQAQDLAIVKLTSPVTVKPINRHAGSVASLLGSTMTMVGYGLTGDGVTGDNIDDSLKRAGTNVVDSRGQSYSPFYSNNLILYDFDAPVAGYPNRSGSSSPTSLEADIAPGDSGGPWIVDGSVAGVSSATILLFGSGEYGAVSFATAVKPHNDWINEVIGGVNWNSRDANAQFGGSGYWGDNLKPLSGADVQFSLPYIASSTPSINFAFDETVRNVSVKYGPHNFISLSDSTFTITNGLVVDDGGTMNLSGCITQTDSISVGRSGIGTLTVTDEAT